jgi:hypothetical protein
VAVLVALTAYQPPAPVVLMVSLSSRTELWVRRARWSQAGRMVPELLIAAP